MKLDVQALRYMSKEEFRVLTAVEMGMKNHDIVPKELIMSIAGLKHGGAHKQLDTLLKHKLISHDRKKYDGYKLTYSGYDFLALKAMINRGSIAGFGKRIGVGKESDIFLVVNEDGKRMALKLHRLGRVSFRSIKNNRDYLRERKSANWLYLSRLAAVKEYAYMKALYENDFPVPTPIDQCRHAVLMELVPAYPLANVKHVHDTASLYSKLMNLILRFAAYGLIHGDFNEFNLMVNDAGEPTVIDFPQMVSTSHYNGEYYFNRDVECIKVYFKRRYHYESHVWPKFQQHVKKEYDLDVDLAASGWTKDEESTFQKTLESMKEETKEDATMADDGDDDDVSDESEEESSDEEYEDGLDGSIEVSIDQTTATATTRNRSASDAEVPITKLEVDDCNVEEDGGDKPAGDAMEDGDDSDEDSDQDSAEDSDEEPAGETRKAMKERQRAEEKAKASTSSPAKTRRSRRKQTTLTEDAIKDRVKRQLSKKNAVKGHRNSMKNKERRANMNAAKML
eukprot:GFYU01009683.1.p1 GENE.GFYU01009683.1~~GFYU01009683.1.p1  ORF type:complete len:509 (-),score=160.80 GFYU01009683.1:188-1714(-)